MRHLKYSVKNLSSTKKFALISSGLGLLATFMPWHTIGDAAFDPVHSYSGFEDQNLIIGLIIFIFLLIVLILIGLPLLGIRLPRLPVRESSAIIFLGGEPALLTLVLMIMQTTSITYTVNNSLRFGIYLAFFTTITVFFCGLLLRNEENPTEEIFNQPLTRVRGLRIVLIFCIKIIQQRKSPKKMLE
jgi:hypothetical protein